MAELTQGVYPSPIKDPYADETTQPFWDAALEGRLIVPRCEACSTFVLPPQPFCFECRGKAFEWTDLPGTGTVYSYTVVTHGLSPALKQVVPYVSAVIDLDGTQGAGARMLANVTDCDPASIKIGTKVRIWFDKISDTLALPRFAPDID